MTFDLIKSSLWNHFVLQNYKDIAYRRYKIFSQGNLSILDYSIQFRTLADQLGMAFRADPARDPSDHSDQIRS